MNQKVKNLGNIIFVQTWKKIQLDISNWRIGKIKCR
jgi:hypothetical protein